MVLDFWRLEWRLAWMEEWMEEYVEEEARKGMEEEVLKGGGGGGGGGGNGRTYQLVWIIDDCWAQKPKPSSLDVGYGFVA